MSGPGRPSALERHPRKVAAGAALTAGALAAAVALIGAFEGKRNTTYFDIVGVPTACYGHTGADVKAGVHYSDDACNGQLAADIRRHYAGLVRCAPEVEALPDAPKIAFTSLVFNLGPGIVCSSRPFRPRKPYARQGLGWYLKIHDLKSSCAAISRYASAGGKVSRGLAIRRAAERKLCEQGV